MPRRAAAWSSWNVDQAACDPPGAAVTMTYHMNRLQALPGPTQLLRLGQPGRPRPRRAGHPGPRRSATRSTRSGRSTSQAAIGRLQGHRGTYYAGAHLGYGFHEDGCRSGFEVAELLGDRRDGEERAA